ncbi:hypothetical protein D3C71_2125740 [compost metagenome]
MENECGEQAEERKGKGCDLRLESKEDGEAGNNFKDTGNVSKCSCARQTSSGNHASCAGWIDEFRETREQKHSCEKYACAE